MKIIKSGVMRGMAAKYAGRHIGTVLAVSVIMLSSIILLGGCHWLVPTGTGPDITQNKTLDELWKSWEKKGFTRNADFSAKIRPGVIIQTVSRGNDNQPIQEASPIVFQDGADCFPNVKTDESAIPDVWGDGSDSSAFVLDTQLIKKVLPSLNIDASMVDTYSLALTGMKTVLIPRAKLLNMADTCNISLDETLKRGDQLAWFRIINEVITAEGITFEVTWTAKGGINLGFQRKLAEDIAGPTATFAPSTSSKRGASLKTDKRIVISYKSRPVENIKN